MAMQQIGRVTESTPDTITVRIDRESACGGNCAGCNGCPSGAVTVACPNDPVNPFLPGELVKLEMPVGTFFHNAFWSYGFLALLMLFGAILGYWLSRKEIGSVLGGFGALTLGILLQRILFKKKRDVFQVQRLNSNYPIGKSGE